MAEAQPEGRRIASRYHLLEAIGRGGMGIVWRAHDELLDREVAIKEVRYADTLGEDNQEDFNRRTKREARAAGRLTHPNVVVVHDVVEEDGRPWIVMQLVESRSLGKVLRQDGPLPPRRVAEIGLALLEALRAAHAQGVLHRDVKPENVLLADDGRVVLTDFGIATLEAETALTMTGIAGTPAFIPPERIKGGSAQRESDLWSLGATLYAAVEGRPPHDRGGALPTMHAILNDEPEPPVNAGPLAPVLEGLLRKDPALRMPYKEAARLLRAVSEGAGERPARTAVMPAAGRADGTDPSADTDPGLRFRTGDVPQTGAKLGAAPPAGAAGAAGAPPTPTRREEWPEPVPPQGGGGRRQDGSAARPGTPGAAGAASPRAVPEARPAKDTASKDAKDAKDRDGVAEGGAASSAGAVPGAKDAPGAKGGPAARAGAVSASGAAPGKAVPAPSTPSTPSDPEDAAASRAVPGRGATPSRGDDASPAVGRKSAGAATGAVDEVDAVPAEDVPAPRGGPGAGRPAARGSASPSTPASARGAVSGDAARRDRDASASGAGRESAPARPRPVPAPRPNPFPPVAAAARDGAPAPSRKPVPPAAAGQVAGRTPEQASAHAGHRQDEVTSVSGGSGGSQTKRGLLVLLPVLLVVGVVAGWLGMNSRKNEGTPQAGPGAPSTSGASDGPTGGAVYDPSKGSPEASAPSSSSPASSSPSSASPSPPAPSPSPTKTEKKSPLPAGWRMHKDSNGFSLGLPKGWSQDKRRGNQVWFRGPDRTSFVMIDYVDKARPDPKQDWLEYEPTVRSKFSGYKLIRIENVSYMKKASDWEFTWNTSSGKARVINRGFITKGGRGYAIYWHTLDKNWKKNMHLFEGFAATFSSKK
ncbi:protein kinase [Streptosporangium sp. NPDC023615]|uniref:serine/threonine protein kinase n=1 Tax=Streptosporangium sp. NPDC023615 TaxID=3154794 RepID=UPI003436AFA0